MSEVRYDRVNAMADDPGLLLNLLMIAEGKIAEGMREVTECRMAMAMRTGWTLDSYSRAKDLYNKD